MEIASMSIESAVYVYPDYGVFDWIKNLLYGSWFMSFLVYTFATVRMGYLMEQGRRQEMAGVYLVITGVFAIILPILTALAVWGLPALLP